MEFVPCLQRPAGEVPRLGEVLLDEYLRFVAARCRPNTLLAQMFDLKVFFTVVGRPPVEVTTADVVAAPTSSTPPRTWNPRWQPIQETITAKTAALIRLALT